MSPCNRMDPHLARDMPSCYLARSTTSRLCAPLFLVPQAVEYTLPDAVAFHFSEV